MSDLVRAEYDGACISNVVAALLGKRKSDWLPEAARGAKTVVLFVLDGLGWSELQKHRARMPLLSEFEGAPITSVVPSTTSTALTSITTGAPASKHGITGLRMVDGTRTVHALRWLTSDATPPPEPERFQPLKPFGGTSVPVVTRSLFKATGFSSAHLRGTRFYGWHATSTLVERCRVLAEDGEPFVYAYYDGIDHLSHIRGLDDRFTFAELAFADRLVGEILDALPPSAALVVTADHGQVSLGSGAWVSLDPGVLSLVRAHAGDARFRFLHAVDGAASDLLDLCRQQLGDLAWVLSRDEAMPLLGPHPARGVPDRVGDVVLAARAPVAFIDPEFPEEVRLRSGHGSLTPEEMLVPLLAARGRSAT